MKLQIELPDELAADMIKNAATLRKRKNSQGPGNRPGQIESAVDKNLPDQEYLAAEIREGIVNDHLQVVKAQAAHKASLDAESAERAKISGKKK